MSDDDWADLFSAAAGEPSSSATTSSQKHPLTSPSDLNPNPPKKSKKSKKKKKRQRQRQTPETYFADLFTSLKSCRRTPPHSITSVPQSLPFAFPSSTLTSQLQTLLLTLHTSYPPSNLSRINRLDSFYYELYYLSLSSPQFSIPTILEYHSLNPTSNPLSSIITFRTTEIKSYITPISYLTLPPPPLLPPPKTFTPSYHTLLSPPLISSYHTITRTYLCHIYSYYLLPPSSLNYLKSLNFKRLVDYGAGTGYILSQLLNANINAVGYDLEGFNEYHGLTPPWSTKVYYDEYVYEGGDLIMLGYPCPDNDMGVEALERFKGDWVVYVGEFRGVTGTREFENRLRKEYKCVKVEECVSWGEDASKFTVWRRGKEEIGETFEPIRCGGCEERATIRCCLFRQLEFCGWECAESVKGREVIERRLKERGIPVEAGRRREFWREIEEI
ncbi:hypothetical protein TrST_g2721 [Triparma strigata]|uniref:Uncharacterized protein n=1 Tax=Triparma strigata TaxID=1606541 RepID=A0A9W7EXX5_9STRA|nr:hypothetical protein TrST_g2721 [Triparma strigata]